jgi:protoporphyrinogen oxidase
MQKILIIGAGPTGLSAALRLKELGYKNFLIFERRSYAGGLCASFKDDKGFTWDLGGHVIYSSCAYFDKLLKNVLDSDLLEHKRRAWIRTMDRWIPYPFQNNIRYLPKEVMLECLEGLKNSSLKNKSSANFQEWIVDNLGEGIVKYFMFPYNFKVWAYPLHLLSTDWVEQMINKVELNELIFKYPLYGGIGEIFRRTASSLGQNIEFNSALIRINPEKKKIYLSSGKEETYDVLINTSPLDKFLKLIEDGNKDLLDASADLKHNGVLVVGIGMHKPLPDNKSWIYFPDDSSPFFRVTYLSNYSPNNTPDSKKYSSLLCESAYSEYKKEDKSAIIENTVQGLINAGLIDASDRKFIVSTFLFDIDYAYPLPTLERNNALNKIQSELEKRDIYSRGRFGAWKYEISSMHHSIMQGNEITERILETA